MAYALVTGAKGGVVGMGGRNLRRAGSLGVALVVSSGTLAAMGAFAPLAGAAAGTSDDFAGYGAAISNKTANTVTAAFTVPALNCATTPTTAVPISVEAGLGGGFGTKTALGVAAGVAEGCKGTTAGYVIFADAGHSLGFGKFLPAAGDKITISARESTTGSSVTIADTTQGKSLSETDSGVQAELAFWGVQPQHNSSEIPTFASVKITAGLDGANPAATAKPDKLVDGTTIEIAPGAMTTTGTTGTFSDTFKAN